MTKSISSKASQDYITEDHGFDTLQFLLFLDIYLRLCYFLNVYQKIHLAFLR